MVPHGSWVSRWESGSQDSWQGRASVTGYLCTVLGTRNNSPVVQADMLIWPLSCRDNYRHASYPWDQI